MTLRTGSSPRSGEGVGIRVRARVRVRIRARDLLPGVVTLNPGS